MGEKREELVKGIKAKIEDKATELIVAGVKDGKSDDELKTSVFSLGVPFSKLGKLYNAILKKEGLVIDVKTVKKGISEKLAACNLDYSESWAQLKEVSDAICENVKDATQSRVFAQMRAMFKENDKEMPRKTATKRGRMGVVNKTLIDVFKANKQATAEDLIEALSKVVKSPKVAADYTKSNYAVCYAIANDLSSLEVLTVLAKAKEAKKEEVTE